MKIRNTKREKLWSGVYGEYGKEMVVVRCDECQEYNKGEVHQDLMVNTKSEWVW